MLLITDTIQLSFLVVLLFSVFSYLFLIHLLLGRKVHMLLYLPPRPFNLFNSQ